MTADEYGKRAASRASRLMEMIGSPLRAYRSDQNPITRRGGGAVRAHPPMK